MPVLLYRSSAGSGKTFTLVREFINLALAQKGNARKTLAITFTNKATAEMKNRVLDTLKDLAGSQNNALSKVIVDDQGDSKKTQIEAENLLLTLLHDYNNFSISTIDSFFTRIVRPFSKELGLPVNFEISLDQQEVVNDITHRLMSLAADKHDLRQFLTRFISSNINSGRTWNIEGALKEAAIELLNEETSNIEEIDLDTVKNFAGQLHQIKSMFEENMEKFGRKGLSELINNNLSHDDFKYKSNGPAGYFSKILKTRKAYSPNSYVINAWNDPEQFYGNKADKEVIETADALHKILCEIMEFNEKHHTAYITANELLKTIYSFGVRHEFLKLFRQYKKDHNIILISDLNRLINDHLSAEPVPFIYSFAGIRYKHFFLDEFQDTSRVQWENLFPLLENAAGEGGHLLMVGDAKQSIYRWRGGDPSIMESEIQNAFEGNLKEHNLEKNFRSCENIIRFNNKFFRISGELLQHYAPSTIAGKVFDESLEQVPHNDDNNGFAEIYFPPKEKNKADNFDQCNDILINTIEELYADNFGPGDIMLLVRENKEAAELASFLLDKNYPCISETALYLENHPAVRFLLSLLQYLGGNEDSFKLREAAFIYQHQIQQEGFDPKLLNEPENMLPEELFSGLSQLAGLPAYEAAERIYDLALQSFQNNAYLLSFFNVLHQFREQSGNSISEFNNWWRPGKHEINTGNSSGIIRIMTLHKAKGLEFPAVIMPYAFWKVSKGGNTLWVKPKKEPFSQFSALPVNSNTKLAKSYFSNEYELEQQLQIQDNVNLLYVGFTRAIERLTIIAPQGKSESTAKNTAAWISSVLKEEISNQYYSFGKRHPKVSAEEATSESYKLPLREKDSTVIAAAKATGRKSEDTEEKERKAGKVLHDMLAEVMYFDQQDEILSKFLELYNNDPELTEIPDKFNKLFEKPGIRSWLPTKAETEAGNIKILTEQSLITPGGRIYRPDRIVVNKDMTRVIDFKTGEKHPDHHKQLEDYARLLQKMGYSNIKKVLVYLSDEIEVIEI